MTTLYGIPNCDKVKAARRWLDGANVPYTFHDLRVDGVAEKQLRAWLAELGWETLINRRSTSWKALPATTREAMNDSTALAAILEAPTLIKRPLLDHGGALSVGFSAEQYREIFG